MKTVRYLCSRLASLLVIVTAASSCSGPSSTTTAAPTPTPASLAVSCDATTLSAVGQQAHCQARLTRSDGSTQDQTTAAQWSSTNSTIVTAASGGVISAVAIGSADVIASVSGLTGRQAVGVSLACAFSVSPLALSFPYTGGAQMVTLSAGPAGCSPSAWAATASQGLAVSPASGSGNAALTVTAPANASAAQTPTVTIAGQVVTTVVAAAPPPPPVPKPPRMLSVTLTQGEQLSGPYAGVVTGPKGFSCTLPFNAASQTCPAVAYDDGTTVVLTVTLTVATFDVPINSALGCDARTQSTCTVALNGDRAVTISIGCGVRCGEPIASTSGALLGPSIVAKPAWVTTDANIRRRSDDFENPPGMTSRRR